MLDFLNPVGDRVVPYLNDISTAMIACLLVMAGGEINRFLRKVLRDQNFIVRTLIFIFINSFGYGLLIVKCVPYLRQGLLSMPTPYMLASILVAFIIIGMWAQDNRHV